MPSAFHRSKVEVDKFLRSMVEQSADMENWELGSYMIQENFSPFGREITLTLSLRFSKPTGSPTSGSGGKAKAETGTGSGSQPGKARRRGVDRG